MKNVSLRIAFSSLLEGCLLDIINKSKKYRYQTFERGLNEKILDKQKFFLKRMNFIKRVL